MELNSKKIKFENPNPKFTKENLLEFSVKSPNKQCTSTRSLVASTVPDSIKKYKFHRYGNTDDKCVQTRQSGVSSISDKGLELYNKMDVIIKKEPIQELVLNNSRMIKSYYNINDKKRLLF